MKISAILHPQSPQARDWRVRNRPSGRIGGVLFSKHGTTYVSDPLSADAYTTLRKNPYLKFDMLAEFSGTRFQGPPQEADDPAGISVDDLLNPVTPRPRGRPPKKLISDEELFGDTGT